MMNNSKYAEDVLERRDKAEAEVEPPLPEVLKAAISSPSKVRYFAINGLFVLAIFYTCILLLISSYQSRSRS
jgi:hypothetical protein